MLKKLSHIAPNLILVAGIFLLVVNELLALAFLLVALSKWQMFLGGPKLWLNNIRANGCDLLVAFSVVALLGIFDQPTVQYGVIAFWTVWLLLIKPQSKPALVALQAGICQLLSLMVIFLVATYLPGVVLVGLAYFSAFISAEHFLSAHEDRSSALLKAVWGLLVAEITWVLSRWVVLYPVWDGRFAVPQAAVLITLIGYILGSMYLDHTHKKLRKRRLAGYLVLLGGLLLVILFGTTWDARV